METTTGSAGLAAFLVEIQAAVDGGAWVLALSATLALPDVCGAIDADNGQASGRAYRQWCTEYLSGNYPALDPAELWKMRCGLLHQGRAVGSGFTRVIFLAPGPTYMHNNIINDALNLDLPTFAGDVMDAVRHWQTERDGSELYERNIAAFIRWYPEGLAPYIVGAPILT
jgi:hypothetical protein